MEATNILALHPEWDKTPQCLHLPLVSRDMTTIPDSADHISPCSWRASQSLGFITPPTVWIQGQCRLKAEYPFASDVLHAVESTPNGSLLAPFGTLLVHTSFLADDVKDTSHNDVLHSLAPEAWQDPSCTGINTEIPIIGNRMCKLEDVATALEWANEDHTNSNAVELADSGGPINKCRALSLLFKYSKSTSSTDRLH